MKEIYFDAAATTKPRKEVLEVFNELSLTTFANSSSSHKLGFEAESIINKSRSQIAKYLNCKSDEIIFTSGATESNNLAIKGASYHNASWGKHLITTKAEHPSVLNVFSFLEKQGFEVTYIDYDKNGNLNLDQLSSSIKSTTTLVSIMSVNNELGFIFPIDKIYKIIKSKSKAILHTDATQAIGKMNLDFPYDLLSFSLHKIEGLKGIGILVKKSNVQLDPQNLGGEQEFGLRGGTSPVPLIGSSATAIRLTFQEVEKKVANSTLIWDYLNDELSKIPEIIVLSKKSGTPFILSFALTNHKASIISQALSDNNIFVGTKSACSEKVHAYSSVVLNAGYSKEISENVIRLSFSGEESLEDAKYFITKLKEILNTTKGRN